MVRVPCEPRPPRIGDRRVVSQPLVRPRVAQRAVDLLPAVNAPVSVRLRARPGRLVPLIPERQEARGPGGPAPVAAAGSPGHRNAAESTSTPQSTAATTTPAPVSPSPGLRRTSVGRTSGQSRTDRIGRSDGGGSNPGLRMRGALRLRTSGRARTAMTSRARIRQVAIVPKRETIRTSGISIPGRASRMIASSTRSPSVPASARNSSHRAGSTTHPAASRRRSRSPAPHLRRRHRRSSRPRCGRVRWP